jgi:tetratricopeptide (TPR) repeat protein
MPIRKKTATTLPVQPAHPSSARVRRLLIAGVALIGGAWFLRSSAWMHDKLLQGKDLQELQAIVRDHPDDATAQFYLGKRLMQAHQVAEARAAFDSAARLEPSSAQAHFQLGYALFEQHDLKPARTEFEKAKSLDDKLAPAEYMLGKIDWSERKIPSALPHFKRATELEPKLDEAWYGMGLCLIQTRQLEEAIAAMRKAIAINGRRPEYPAALGELEMTQSDSVDDARRQYEHALQIDPNYGQACALMGEFLAHHFNGDMAGSLARAETLLLKATTLPTNRPQDVYRALGEVYIDQKQYRKAVPMLQESIQEDPNDERAYFLLIKAYRGLGNTRSADATEARFKYISACQVEKYKLESRLSIQPRDPAARLRLAHICLDFGLVPEAALHYRVYLRLRPDAHDAVLEQQLRERTAADAARLRLRSDVMSLDHS